MNYRLEHSSTNVFIFNFDVTCRRVALRRCVNTVAHVFEINGGETRERAPLQSKNPPTERLMILVPREPISVAVESVQRDESSRLCFFESDDNKKDLLRRSAQSMCVRIVWQTKKIWFVAKKKNKTKKEKKSHKAKSLDCTLCDNDQTFWKELFGSRENKIFCRYANFTSRFCPIKVGKTTH